MPLAVKVRAGKSGLPVSTTLIVQVLSPRDVGANWIVTVWSVPGLTFTAPVGATTWNWLQPPDWLATATVTVTFVPLVACSVARNVGGRCLADDHVGEVERIGSHG